MIQGIRGFLRSHPILCLALLSPGIPEYLSGSSALSSIILNPLWFVIQIGANLGLYLPGVLLTREAVIRWHKGLASVLLMGAAYGILEEGIALSTLFYPKASPVGWLGVYGHWMGVNWIWLSGIVPVHMIFSITLPIVLLGLALPDTKRMTLIPGRKLALVLSILSCDVFLLLLFSTNVYHYWMGNSVFVGSLLAIGALVLAAYKVPAGILAPRSLTPSRGPLGTFILGVAFYLAVLLTEGVGGAAHLPPLLDFALVVLVQALFLAYAIRTIGAHGNGRQLVSLALGLVLPIMTFGLISEIKLPLVIVADAAFLFFMRWLYRKYRPSIVPTQAATTTPEESPHPVPLTRDFRMFASVYHSRSGNPRSCVDLLHT